MHLLAPDRPLTEWDFPTDWLGQERPTKLFEEGQWSGIIAQSGARKTWDACTRQSKWHPRIGLRIPAQFNMFSPIHYNS